MSQRVEAPSAAEAAALQRQRDWVAGHFDHPSSYGTVAAKLKVVQAVLDNGWVEAHETWKLQALGVALGDALVQELAELAELAWVTVEDAYGRDPALRFRASPMLVFPLTAISKRVERGEQVDVYALFGAFLKTITGEGATADGASPDGA